MPTYEGLYPGAVDPDPHRLQAMIESGEMIRFNFVSPDGQASPPGEAYIRTDHKRNPPGMREMTLRAFAEIALQHTPRSLVRETIGQTITDHNPSVILASIDTFPAQE